MMKKYYEDELCSTFCRLCDYYIEDYQRYCVGTGCYYDEDMGAVLRVFFSNSIRKLERIFCLALVRMGQLPNDCWNDNFFSDEISFSEMDESIMSGIVLSDECSRKSEDESLEMTLLRAAGFTVEVRELMLDSNFFYYRWQYSNASEEFRRIKRDIEETRRKLLSDPAFSIIAARKKRFSKFLSKCSESIGLLPYTVHEEISSEVQYSFAVYFCTRERITHDDLQILYRLTSVSSCLRVADTVIIVQPQAEYWPDWSRQSELHIPSLLQLIRSYQNYKDGSLIGDDIKNTVG